MSLELIRASIRQTVEKHGDQFKRAAPSAITISLVGAALLPVALGTLPMSGPMLAMLGLAGGVGQGLLGNWLTDFVGRMKQERQAKSVTEDEIRAQPFCSDLGRGHLLGTGPCHGRRPPHQSNAPTAKSWPSPY
jgi:hypothetical protein